MLALQLGGLCFFMSFSTRSSRFSIWLEVADHQVELDVLDVAQRIDGADVGDGVVFEGAQHVDQRIHVAQAGEERGLLQRLLADGGDVGVFHRGVDGFSWAA